MDEIKKKAKIRDQKYLSYQDGKLRLKSFFFQFRALIVPRLLKAVLVLLIIIFLLYIHTQIYVLLIEIKCGKPCKDSAYCPRIL